jgi:hypothetical protein
MKTCPDCGEEKPLTEENFYAKRDRAVPRFQARCKACDNRNRAERYVPVARR